MKRFLLTAAALTLLTVAAQAAPKMPVHFKGSWCASDSDEHLVRCGDDDGGYHFTADGFSVGDDYACRLLTLTPHPGQGYDATFRCEGGTQTKPFRRKYWIGFDSSLLFMRDAK
jgi:hypothetical protein